MEKTFADILRDKLGTENESENTAAPLSFASDAWMYQITGRHEFQHLRLKTKGYSPSPKATTVDSTRAEQASSTQATPVQKKAVQVEPDRLLPRARLTEGEQAALSRLIALSGLSIYTDELVSWRRLKKAYRLLARRLHPDSHPEATAIEKARYAREFAFMRQDYLKVSHLFQHAPETPQAA